MVDPGGDVRANDVRVAIASAVEGIAPDTIAHTGDVFAEVHGLSEGLPIDRQFLLVRSAPQEPAGALVMAADPYAITFDLHVSYLPTPDVSKRMLDDGDKVVDALKGLPGTYDQIHNSEINGAADFDDEHGNRTASWSIRVIYDRRDA